MPAGKVLIVTGMHRSGTSLAASWLQRCGLHVGTDLDAGDYSNLPGHFEDHDLVAFHAAMFAKNGLKGSSGLGLKSRERLHAGQEELRFAAELIRSRRDRTQWGWKDPRTTLFLDFWKTMLPGMKVLAVYREPPAVVGSLLRRWRARVVAKRPASLASIRGPGWIWRRLKAVFRYSWINLGLVRRCAEDWLQYDRELIEFARRHPEDLVLLRIDHLLDHSADVIEAINSRWGFCLKPVPLDEVFDPALLRGEPYPLAALIVRKLVRETTSIVHQLEELERSSLQRIGILSPSARESSQTHPQGLGEGSHHRERR